MTFRRLQTLSLSALVIASTAALAQPVPGLPELPARRARNTAKQPEPPVDQATADRKALDAASLKEDDPKGLLDYLRQRTLSDTDLSKIQAVIRRLGADDFEERLRASAEVERFGPAAVGPLRTAAQNDADFEIAFRAGECLRRMEKVPHSAVAAAAVRALARSRPPEAAGVLLAFLPLADDDSVGEEIRAALKAMAVRDGKAEPALVAALMDMVAERRAAAAVALIEGGPSSDRIRVPDAYQKVRMAAKSETDVDARFRMTFSLLLTARDAESVGQLIDSLPALPRGRLWQAEDYLLQLAGKKAPAVVLGKSKESLTRARDAWREWWAKVSSGTDLGKFAYTARVTGKTLLVLMDYRGLTSGAVVELGPDLKERWKIVGLSAPMDAQFLPDGSLAIAEHNSNRVTVRDTAGRILASRTIGSMNKVYGNPQQIQVLESGNLLVTCRNVIVEFKRDKDEEVMRYVRTNYDINAAYRLPDGQTLVLSQNGPNHGMFLDKEGKEQPDRKLKTGPPYFQAHITAAGPDRVLLTELDKVVEYDLKKNESVWKRSVNQPRSVQRLPNGNTLVVEATPNSNRLVEFTPDGEEVWSHQPTSGLQVFRAYRR
ncbi:MAG TPA: hypothetical protein VM533_08525 [Fimbriiglobus sp.]|nr:hypothetical protein [Fimbriiglobus sp.]